MTTDYSLNPFDVTPGESIERGPFTVTIWHDDHGENPWEAWDTCTPALVRFYRGDWTEYGGANLRDFFSHVDAAWVSRNWRKIADALDTDQNTHDADARETAREYDMSLGEARLEMFRTELSELTADSDLTDTLAALYNLLGWPAHALARNGYSQGDYMDALFVSTPDFMAHVGIDPKSHDFAKDHEGDANLMAAWAFGDVYGYTVADTATGETLDSCGGFYGTLWDDPHVLEEATRAMEWATAQSLKGRAKALAACIRNRVPLALRPAILDAAARPVPV